MTVKIEEEAFRTRDGVHIDGWQKYCEYFHTLDADIQHTSALAAQRYSSSSAPGGGTQLRAREDDGCFDYILSCIKKDKPLVRLVNDEEDPLVPDDNIPEGANVRVLAQSDLELVQKQLRAAAFSSNKKAVAATAAEHAEMAAEVAAEMDDIELPDSLHQGHGHASAVSGEDGHKCTAAIETLLWFGLALGEAPKRHDGPRRQRRHSRTAEQLLLQRELGSHHTDPDSPLADECEFSFDWEFAIREIGLSDAREAEEALQAVRAVEAAEAAEAAEASEGVLNAFPLSDEWDDCATSDRSSTSSSTASDSDSSDSPHEDACNGRRKRRKHDYKKLCQGATLQR